MNSKSQNQPSNLEVNTNSLPFKTYLNHQHRVQVTFQGQGRTHQEFKEECDINTIMSDYMKTGVLPMDMQQRVAQFVDVTEHDFQVAQNLIAEARSMFEDLPSKIRARFQNDPAQLLEFINHAENWQEAQEMGLLAENAVRSIPNPTPEPKTAQNPENPPQNRSN